MPTYFTPTGPNWSNTLPTWEDFLRRNGISTPVFNPNISSGGIGVSNGSGIKVTTPQVSAGVTTLDKFLGTFLSYVALQKNAGYVPTTTVPENNYNGAYYGAGNVPAVVGSGSTGANFGAGIENFVANNTGIILVGVVAFILFKSGRK